MTKRYADSDRLVKPYMQWILVPGDHPPGWACLFEDRGVLLERTMQFNLGGNMDF